MSNSEDPVPLIPTKLRDKLPRGLSQPIGGEALSRALFGCPRYDELWIAFGAKAQALHPAPADAAEFRLAFTVVCNNPTDTWYLSVAAVMSTERAAVRRVMVSAGLPGARSWLCQPRPETWHGGFRTLQVGYALDPLRACFVESLNHKVTSTWFVPVEAADTEAAPAST